MIRTIYLVRHGQLQAADDQKRFVGQIDLPLSRQGIEQAETIRRYFTGNKLDVYCSDLARSRQTAEHIVKDTGRDLRTRTDFREISMGLWEGKTFAEIALTYPKEFEERGKGIENYRTPGGESFQECSSRVVTAFLEIVASSDRDIAIIGHAGINRLLLCYLLGMPISNLFRLGQDYGCINIITKAKQQYRVKAINLSLESRQ